MVRTPGSAGLLSDVRATPLILLSGIPATGKSTLGRWLEQERGFAHIDLEKGGLDRFRLGGAWAQFCRLPPPDAAPFVTALRDLGRPVALDWGFPPHCLPLVQAMHRAGVTAWWFDGDRAAARRAFVKRATVPVGALDVQMHQIETHWTSLCTFFDGRRIDAIHADGTFAPWENILATLVGTR